MLIDKNTGKKLLRRSWVKCAYNIKMDVMGIGVNKSNLVDPAQDGDNSRALVNAALNLRVS